MIGGKEIVMAPNCDQRRIIIHQANIIKLLLLNIIKARSRYADYLDNLLAEVNTAPVNSKRFDLDLEPILNAFRTNKAEQALSKIKKKNGDIPKVLVDLFGKAKFLPPK